MLEKQHCILIKFLSQIKFKLLADLSAQKSPVSDLYGILLYTKQVKVLKIFWLCSLLKRLS